jgi:hypothetical protein
MKNYHKMSILCLLSVTRQHVRMSRSPPDVSLFSLSALSLGRSTRAGERNAAIPFIPQHGLRTASPQPDHSTFLTSRLSFRPITITTRRTAAAQIRTIATTEFAIQLCICTSVADSAIDPIAIHVHSESSVLANGGCRSI